MPIHLQVLQKLATKNTVAATAEAAKTDCSYCRSPCCQFLVELLPEELSRYAHMEYIFPGGEKKKILARRDDGYCVYHVPGKGCSTYDDKPRVCDLYTCRDDRRITPALKYGKPRKVL